MRTMEQFENDFPGHTTKRYLIGPLLIDHRCKQCGHRFHPDAYEFIAFQPIEKQAIWLGKGLVFLTVGIPLAVGILYLASFILKDLSQVLQEHRFKL